jgi:ferritin-like metal-binding protein YciE
MATMQSLHDVFVHELRDLYSAERQLIKALPRMAKNAGNPVLADALTNHLRETEVQVERIEEILKTLGIKSGGVKCKGMEGLIEEGEEVLAMDGDAKALDAAMIGAAQRVEHYEIAGYLAAISHAKAQGHTEAVRLLEETLKEEQNADEILTEIAQQGLADVADTSTMGEAISMAFPTPPVRANGKTRGTTTRKNGARKSGKTRAKSGSRSR